MLKFLKAASFSLLVVASPNFAEKYGLGRPATLDEISAWDWEIMPDGTGLPIGAGNAIDGEEVYADRCA